MVCSLVLSNNQMNTNGSKYYMVLDGGKYLKIKTTDSEASAERSGITVPVKDDTSRRSNYFVMNTALFMHRYVHQQLTEALADHNEIDSLEFVNCNISNSDLHEIKAIISLKRYWKSLNLLGCNIGDDGCSALCPQEVSYGNVTVSQLNLSFNNLTLVSLKYLSQTVLYWKTKVLIISGNDIDQCKLAQTITEMLKHRAFEDLQLQVVTTDSSMYVYNATNCLSTYLDQDVIRFYTVVDSCLSNTVENPEALLSSSTMLLPELSAQNNSGLSSKASLSGTVQIQPLMMITSIVVEENVNKQYCAHCFQEIVLSTPICHLNIANNDITDQKASEISKCINEQKFLESFELVKCNLHKQSLIKILSSLQQCLLLKHISISVIVINIKAAQLLSSVISSNPHLEHLCVSDCELKEQSMITIIQSLREVESLKHFDLSNNYLTDQCAKLLSRVIGLKKFPLSYFNLSNCKVKADGLLNILEALKEISSLNFLSLSTNIINSASAAIQLSKILQTNAELSHLDLSRCMVKEKGLVKIVKSLTSSLQHIDLSFNVITDGIAKGLVHTFIGLKHLLLGNCKMEKNVIKTIFNGLQAAMYSNHYLSLQKLDISGSDFCGLEAAEAEVTTWTNLGIKNINFAACIFSSFSLIRRLLESSPSIENLDMSGNRFDAAAVERLTPAILKCYHLKDLKLSSCSFQNIGLEYMLDCSWLKETRITSLDISYNTINEEVADSLASWIVSNHTLKHLYIQHCDVPKQGFLKIVNAMENHNCLRTLDFSHNKISTSIANVISNVICNCNLNKLVIATCYLAEHSVVAIAEGLARISSLAHLDISHNNTGDLGSSKLASVLLNNASLSHLDISNCNLTEKGFDEICNSLTSLSRLKYLNMAENRISNNVSVHLSSVLSTNPDLIHFNVSNCGLKEQGLGRLLDALCKNNILHYLNLKVNSISDSLAIKICDVISSSTVLHTFKISSSNLSENGIYAIINSLLNDKNIPLHCLDIGLHPLADEKHVCTSFADSHLEYLDTSGCKLEETTFIQLCKSLYTINLSYLNFSNNIITDKVATEIVSVINGTMSLQYINLCNCNLQTVGIISISDALSSIKTLKTFIFCSNNICNISANCVAAVFASNTLLEHVDLSKCALQDVGKSMITHAAEQVTTLKYFLL